MKHFAPSCFVLLACLALPAAAQGLPSSPPGQLEERREQWREERHSERQNDRHSERQNDRHSDRQSERRDERWQQREQWRQMSPEERHQLRRDIRDAGEALYPRGPHKNRQ